jgi:release factor glutamine methyltransferase
MLISEYIKANIVSLASINQIDERETQMILRFLIEDSLEVNRIDFSTYLLDEEKIDLLNQRLERLKKNEPLQYITEKAYFYGLKFEVSPYVLIPRPETEELVHQLLKDFETKKNEKAIFLEVGTGSGCISITLAKNLPHCHFIAVDVSEDALKIAQKNAQTNNVDNIEFIKLDFLQENLYSSYPQLQNINHIISNPPYIRESEKLEMNANVLDYEPHVALFVEENNPLIFYKALAKFFVNQMRDKDGLLYVEINQYLANETKALFESFGLKKYTVFKDLQENSRFIRASNK